MLHGLKSMNAQWGVQEWEKFISNIYTINHIQVAIPLPYGSYV